MTSKLRLLGAVAAVAIVAVGCGEKTGADKFVGSWIYAGAIEPNCTGQAVEPMDLTGVTTTITASDSSHISVALGTICSTKFDVDGSVATAGGGQNCTLDVPSLGALSPLTINITRWTMTVSGDMNTIASDFSGTALICVPTSVGTLTRLPDGGAATP
jgi:hypothetical protein